MFVFLIARAWWFARAGPKVDGAGDRRRIGESAKLSSHRVRDRTNGAHPVSRVEPAWSSGGLRREPASLLGAQVTCDPTRPILWLQRRPRIPRTLARTGFFKPVHVKSLQAHALRSLIIARKKLVGQRVTLENQIRGLAVVFGIRLPRALAAAFIDQALKASEGIAGLSAAMRGLITARTAVMTAVAAIDADIRRMTRASAACRRLMTIPGVGQLTALAFVAAIDDPSRIRRSRDVGAYLGLVPRRYQSGEVDYVGSISKCGDRRVRTLLYEAANVMLTRYKGQLKLKDCDRLVREGADACSSCSR